MRLIMGGLFINTEMVTCASYTPGAVHTHTRHWPVPIKAPSTLKVFVLGSESPIDLNGEEADALWLVLREGARIVRLHTAEEPVPGDPDALDQALVPGFMR